jgi:hypothetical protein
MEMSVSPLRSGTWPLRVQKHEASVAAASYEALVAQFATIFDGNYRSGSSCQTELKDSI